MEDQAQSEANIKEVARIITLATGWKFSGIVSSQFQDNLQFYVPGNTTACFTYGEARKLHDLLVYALAAHTKINKTPTNTK